jgi:hypoxanthine phosphoribosyltransferase
MNELNNFNFNPDVFSFNEPKINSRYIKPPKQKDIPYKKLKYTHAKNLAKDIDFKELDKVFCIIGGSFIFGDFIEAFIVENNINCIEVQISTLSYSQDNIDSLENLIKSNYIQKLDLIVSDFFFSH